MTAHELELLSRDLAGELSADERAALDARLATEPELRRARRRLEQLVGVALEPSDDDARAALAALDALLPDGGGGDGGGGDGGGGDGGGGDGGGGDGGGRGGDGRGDVRSGDSGGGDGDGGRDGGGGRGGDGRGDVRSGDSGGGDGDSGRDGGGDRGGDGGRGGDGRGDGHGGDSGAGAGRQAGRPRAGAAGDARTSLPRDGGAAGRGGGGGLLGVGLVVATAGVVVAWMMLGQASGPLSEAPAKPTTTAPVQAAAPVVDAATALSGVVGGLTWVAGRGASVEEVGTTLHLLRGPVRVTGRGVVSYQGSALEIDGDVLLATEPGAVDLHGMGRLPPSLEVPVQRLTLSAGVIVFVCVLGGSVHASPPKTPADAGPRVTPAPPAEHVTLQRLQSHLLVQPGLQRWAVQGDAVKLQPAGPNRVLALAVQPGQATVQLWDATAVRTVVFDVVRAPATLQGEFDLEVGELRIAEAPGLLRYSLGDATVAAVLHKNGRVRIKALRVGETTLQAWWDEDGPTTVPIRVRPASPRGPREEPESPISLELGLQRLLQVPGARTVHVEPSHVVTALLTGGSSLLLVGAAVGDATVTVKQTDGRERRIEVAVRRPRPPPTKGDRTLALASAPAEVSLAVGETLAFEGAGVSRARISGAVADLNATSGAVLVRGVTPGEAVVTVEQGERKTAFKVLVTESSAR